MNVTLLARTPNPERLVATAARLCYSADDVETIMDEMCDHDAEKQIKLFSLSGMKAPSNTSVSRLRLREFRVPFSHRSHGTDWQASLCGRRGT